MNGEITTPKELEVNREISILEENSQELLAKVNGLKDRLKPILSIKELAELQGKTLNIIKCPLAERIEKIKEQVKSAKEIVKDILNELEI